MSLNWKELELIVEELDFTGCRLQSIVQHNFHSLSWIFHSSQKGRWTLYTEIGTQYARIHESKDRKDPSEHGKTKKLQRFVQFCRANIEGAKVLDAKTVKGDRVFILELSKENKTYFIYFRLYSGPGANIVICDKDNRILDLLYRRPKRDEITGKILPNFEEKEDNGKFQIRERNENLSFNEQIEKEYGQESTDYTLEQLVSKLENIKSKVLKKHEGLATSLRKKIVSTENYKENKMLGDLLAANIYLIKPHMEEIEVDNWETGEKVKIKIDSKINPSQNIESYYDKYQKAKTAYTNACENYEIAIKDYEQKQAYYNNLLTLSGNEGRDIQRLKKALEKEQVVKEENKDTVGLVLKCGSFTVLVGRNAKENDFLLRHKVKGNDWWLHTRDYPGGYVFIKNQRDKSVPLDIILDAANLAVLYSKAKNSKSADLYYTQVKYLRRAKNGPLGLVLPTQEKNIHIDFDEKRITKIFNNN